MTMLEPGLQPASYGRIEEEYWALRDRVGIGNLSNLGRLTITGRDRSSFLNGLVTNDIANLKEHNGIRACLLTPKARVQADLYIYNLGDRLLIDTGESDPSKIRTILDRFVITEDVQIHDSTSQLALLTVQGPQATGAVQDMLRIDISNLKSLMSQELGPSIIVSRDRTGKTGYDIILPQEETDPVWEGFLLKGVVPFGTDALNIHRLEACIPRFGVDVDENTLVLEAGMKDAISFSKGCYMGQETVARATFIGHVNKRLAQFTAKIRNPPASRARLVGMEDREAGTVTSAAYSPGMEGTVGLAYVQNSFAKEGTRVQLADGKESSEITITRLA